MGSEINSLSVTQKFQLFQCYSNSMKVVICSEHF